MKTNQERLREMMGKVSPKAVQLLDEHQAAKKAAAEKAAAEKKGG